MFCDVPRHFTRSPVAKQRRSRLGGAVVILTVAACTSMGGLSPESPPDVKREAVSARAKARWEALIKADITQAYSYLSPASRATTPLDLYKAKHKLGLYRTVKVDDVKCDADICTVDLSLTYDFKQFKGITTPVTEKWVITQGQAWYVYQG